MNGRTSGAVLSTGRSDKPVSFAAVNAAEREAT